ncbi:MAG: CBS domain-containing protein [Acidobacteria bacterium]|nr:MAG: CBS domain-containing protein [Acidobacteriota bacterium]
MKRIKQIIEPRQEIYFVNVGDSVRRVAQRMKQWNVRAVTVMDGERVAGIVSEWDFLTKVVADGRDPERTPVATIMTPDPMTTTPEATYAECLVTMLENDFQHLVVVTPEGELRGTVALGDLLKIDKRERDEVIRFYQAMFSSHR